MKAFFLLIVIILSGAQGVSAQVLPDIVRLSDTDIKVIYRYNIDTLGFRLLSSKTSLKEYKKNRPVFLTLQSIKRSLDWRTIVGTIAGTPLSELQGVSYTDALNVLVNPKYRLTSEGVILIGERNVIAEWNDIATYWKTIDCYFVHYSKQQTELLRSLKVNTCRPIQEWDASYQILSYRYLGLEPEDSLSMQTPPAFDGTAEEFEEHFRMYTDYSTPSIKVGSGGSVIAAFTVNLDKSVTNVRIVEELDPYCDRDVKSLIRDTKDKWLSGTVNGEAVPIEVLLSVTFKLIENSITIPTSRKE